MKKIVAAFIFFCVVLSCTKTSIAIHTNDLAGTWVLKHISGGYAGIDSVPTDNITLAFDNTGKYISTFDYAITSTGNYTIAKATEPNYYPSDILLNLSSDGSQTTYGISLKNDSLALSEGCCDQFGYTYVKQK